MTYREEIKKKINEMDMYEREYSLGSDNVKKHAIELFKTSYSIYKELLKEFIDEMIIRKNIKKSNDKYESILKLKYQEGILKGVDVELVLELIFEEGVLYDRYKYISDGAECEFYADNKEEFKKIVSQIEKCDI